MRRDQENNAVAYYKQVINTLLYKVIIELRAFYIAFIAIISICSCFKIILLLIW
jgi:hypothetical protein